MRFSDGFTLLEVFLVLCLLAIIFAIGVPLVFTFYLDSELVTEKDNLVTILQRARNLAMTGEGANSHGVYFDTDKYVVFEGDDYSNRVQAYDHDFSRPGLVEVTGPSEIVFETLSGRTTSSSFNLDNGRKSLDINVNMEGVINWSI